MQVCRTAGRRYRADLAQVLGDALADRSHLELRAGDVFEQSVGVDPLAFRPKLAEQRPRLALGEPRVAVALAEVGAQLRFEGPRAQVFGDVEARVDVAEVVGLAGFDLQRVA